MTDAEFRKATRKPMPAVNPKTVRVIKADGSKYAYTHKTFRTLNRYYRKSGLMPVQAK
jgi:coenzyme F420-reducing hydrogenase beta subunit